MKTNKPVVMPIVMKQTRAELADRIRPLADRLVEKLVDTLVTKLEDNISQLASGFEMTLLSLANGNGVHEPVQPTRKQLTAGKTKGKTKGKRRSHCKKCGLPGFQTKTHGKTHDENGAIHVRSTGRAGAPPRKAKTKDLAADDEEAAPSARPVPVVAAKPADQQDSPASTPSPAKPIPRPPLIVQVPTLLSRMEQQKTVLPPPPSKKRVKALAEIRLEKLRKLGAKRLARQDEEDDHKSTAREPPSQFDTSDESELEPQALSEREVSSLSYDDI